MNSVLNACIKVYADFYVSRWLRYCLTTLLRLEFGLHFEMKDQCTESLVGFGSVKFVSAV